jgi:hypothetical protein
MGQNAKKSYLIKELSKRTHDYYKLLNRLEAGRQYLMSVQSDKITVEDALEAFGFGRDGLRE